MRSRQAWSKPLDIFHVVCPAEHWVALMPA